MRRLILSSTLTILALCLGTTAQAQTVPYRVTGTVEGNLATFFGGGEAVGLHFGRLTFTLSPVPDEEDPSIPRIFDVQTAADGSQLFLVGGYNLTQEIIPDEDDETLVRLKLVDEYEIVGGTGRFENASSVGPIVSTAISEPFDPTNSPLPLFKGTFQKVGRIDLGKKGPKGKK